MSLQRHGYPGPYVQPGYSNLQPGYQQPGLNMGPIVQQPGLNIGSIVQQPGLNIVPIVEQPLPQGVLGTCIFFLLINHLSFWALST